MMDGSPKDWRYDDKQIISRKVITQEDREESAEVRQKLVTLSEDKGTTIKVDKNDPRYEAAVKGRVCCNCVFFNRELAQEAIRQQRFMERAVHEERWRPEWLKNIAQFGVCEQFSDGQGLRLNEPFAPATCAASDVDSTKLPGTEAGMAQIECPHFRSRMEHGEKFTSSRAGTRRAEH